MKEIFKPENGDMGLVITLKREANYMLASLKRNDSKPEVITETQNLLESAIYVAKHIERTEPNEFEDVNFIIHAINKCWNGILLSPLLLDDDEFSSITVDGKHYNIRNKNIYKDEDGKIHNTYAYNLEIDKYYDNSIGKEIVKKKGTIYKSTKLYISKGGIITGEYIEDCIIPESVVETHNFNIFTPIKFKTSVIIDKDIYIYFIDHRSPELKYLKNYYNVPTYINKTIKDKKYNIRKYTKLK